MLKLPFLNRNKSYKYKPVVLLVMDGFGIAPPSPGNAIAQTHTPNYLSYLKTYPHTELIASGESVGLPANEVGNTEVGHLNLGAGRVIYQDLKRISLSIEDKTFFENKALMDTTSHVRRHNSKLHIVGLVGSGSVHSSLDHFFALMQLAKKEEISRVYYHLFSDGRDSAPNDAQDIFRRIEEHIANLGVGQIASISGRYFAMDRDGRWDRTKRTYETMVSGKGIHANSSEEAIKTAYAKGQSDEFIEPTVILKNSEPVGLIDDNDGLVFFNFRVDRPRQLSMAFLRPDFEKIQSFDLGYDPRSNAKIGKVSFSETFTREKIVRNLFFTTMTEYAKDLPVNGVVFKVEKVEDCLSVVLSRASLPQMHMAESEKERFVTYYFDGWREEPQTLSDIKIVPSPKVSTYDKKPEMSLPSLTSAFRKEVLKDKYQFFIVNIANPDLVGHTGNIKATIKAVECVDKYISEMVNVTLGHDGCVFLTADHGNAEELLSYPTASFFYTSSKGNVNTEHSNNPVPLIVISNGFRGTGLELPKGILGDVAPSILAYMGVQKPLNMTGKNLLSDVISKPG